VPLRVHASAAVRAARICPCRWAESWTIAVANRPERWDRLQVVRALLVLLSATLIAAGCTASHPKAGAAPFATAERAVKATCGAYWFGRYIHNSGTGHVASLDRSPEGVRVTRCRAGAYTHG
jgi:hypothetical protein